MYNSPLQKLQSSTQHSPIQIEDSDDPKAISRQKLVQDMSENISKIMFPLYDGFRTQIENGKVLGLYPVLRLPSAEQVRNNQKSFKPSKPIPSQNYQLNPSVVGFRQLANRVQEKQRLDNLAVSESKIHQLLDQNEARSGYEEDMYSSEQDFGTKGQVNKMMKQRKYLQKLARQMKSSKKMKRRFKDKNRPKKAKSAYNLFVQQVVPQIKGENPSFSAPDLVRVAAKMYNQLTEQEKIPYQRRYLIDKERFERERQVYFRQHPQMDYRMDAKQKASFMSGKYMNM